MTTIEDYFDKILVINRAARTDRWQECEEEFRRFNLTKCERFDAYDHGLIDGHIGGNGGATSSHRAVLDVIAYNKWPRTLVLEDDFKIVHPDFHQRFNDMISEVPEDWQMLYLGGHYQEKPQSRVSKHVIRIGGMLTTSSYGITWQQARKMAPVIYGSGPIDCLYLKYNREDKCYIFQPRLMVQRDSYSDLQGRHMSNLDCMSNTTHENMV
jgi:GR25 family glycosyltransferase involved in LPS biosynthesis